MITLTATSHNPKFKQYIARLTGRSKKFTYKREFVGRRIGAEQRITEADIDERGLYEICNVTEEGARLWTRYVVLEHDFIVVKLPCSRQHCLYITRQLELGLDINQVCKTNGKTLKVLFAKDRKVADKSYKLETVIETCWATLQTLPDREFNFVIRMLKSKFKEQDDPVENLIGVINAAVETN